jgi:peptide/nickel transport system substrate-binding protein
MPEAAASAFGGRRMSRRLSHLYDEVMVERDPERSRALWHRLNDVLVESHSVIPVIDRSFISARSRGLRGPAARPLDLETRNVAAWTR